MAACAMVGLIMIECYSVLELEGYWLINAFDSDTRSISFGIAISNPIQPALEPVSSTAGILRRKDTPERRSGWELAHDHCGIMLFICWDCWLVMNCLGVSYARRPLFWRVTFNISVPSNTKSQWSQILLTPCMASIRIMSDTSHINVASTWYSVS
jgi:hypothetical protein